jgi:MFS transporter, MHS family, proline/betaine transporter
MPASRPRQVAAAVLGNALEWYDFVVFGFLTVIIARLFFPEGSAYSALLFTTATFGVGFVMRPLGGIVLGAYADRHGRKAAMQRIIFMMSVALLMIALTPTHATIGLAAPLVMVLARLLQGFATGGQYAIATAFLVEIAPPGRRGLYGSLQQVGLALAALGGAAAGMLVTVGLSQAQLDAWGWRVPFALGLLIVPVGVYISRHVEETAAFVRLAATPSTRVPLAVMLRANLRAVLVTFGLIVCGTITYYVVLIYMPTFARQELGIALGDAFEVQVVALVCLGVVIPLVGWLSDRIGRRPPLIAGALALLLTLQPLFAYAHAEPSVARLMVMQVALCVQLGVFYGALATAVAEQFPPGVRSTGLSLAYNLAVMLFGGFAQFIVVWLSETTGDPLAAAYYVLFGAAVGLVAACGVRPGGPDTAAVDPSR